MTAESGLAGVTRRVDGLAVYERQRAAPAPTVLFVHGAMDRGASFLKATRQLADLDLVRYDRRGYGRSLGAGVAVDVDAHVEDLLNVVGERSPVTVVGHSFGGVLALIAADRAPDRIGSVLVYEPPCPWLAAWPRGTGGGRSVAAAARDGDAAGAEVFMRAVAGDHVWERLPEATRAARRAEGPALIAELTAIRSLSSPPFHEDGLVGRVVVGCGGLADAHHRLAAEQLAESLRTTVRRIDGAGHGGHLSHPAEFAQLVRDAVALIPPDPSASPTR